MKKQLKPSQKQDYLDIIYQALKAENYAFLEPKRIDKIMARVQSNLDLVESLSKNNRKGVNKALDEKHISFWFFVFIAFLLLTAKIIIENYAYRFHY